MRSILVAIVSWIAGVIAHFCAGALVCGEQMTRDSRLSRVVAPPAG